MTRQFEDVDCPTCGATSGERCKVLYLGSWPTYPPHVARRAVTTLGDGPRCRPGATRSPDAPDRPGRSAHDGNGHGTTPNRNRGARPVFISICPPHCWQRCRQWTPSSVKSCSKPIP